METTTKLSLNEQFAQVQAAKQTADQAQLDYEAALRQLATDHGPSFEVNGKWYQVRSSNSPVQNRRITFLCELKTAPSEWLSKPRGPRKSKATAESVLTNLTSEDGTTTTVIE